MLPKTVLDVTIAYTLRSCKNTEDGAQVDVTIANPTVTPRYIPDPAVGLKSLDPALLKSFWQDSTITVQTYAGTHVLQSLASSPANQVVTIAGNVITGVTKLAAEQLCHLYFVNHKVPTVALRYFTVYGPRQRPDMGFNRFFTAILNDRPLTQYGDGLQTRDFTYVADAAWATHTAAVRGVPGRVYNIGGGSRVSLKEVFELFGTITGRTLRIDQQPAQKGDMRDTYADTTLARTDLGFQPSVNLEEGLRAMYRWMEATKA